MLRATWTVLGGCVAVALVIGAAGAPATAAAKTSVQSTDLSTLWEVSHTGRWIVGANAAGGAIIDRTSGQRTPTNTGYSTSTVVRDNPALTLERHSTVDVLDADGDTVGYRSGPVWLTSAASGSRVRIDSDSAGKPLEPAWTPSEIDEPSLNDTPSVLVSSASVTRDGTMVAFCANYEVRNRFTLYVKDTASGALTKRAEECGAGGPDPGGEYVQVDAPEISFDGKVIHLGGAVYGERGEPDTYFYPDTLVFPRSGKATRTVNGSGSMTRDGSTVFMRIGVRPFGTPDKTGGKVGTYKVATTKVTRLSGRYTIYGNDALWFSAFDKATWRGRYVIHGNKSSVIDRKTGKVYDYGKVMRRHGYPPNRVTTSNSWHSGPMVSGDGKVIFAKSGGKYVAVDWR